MRTYAKFRYGRIACDAMADAGGRRRGGDAGGGG
eukprot:SAG31_NODE_465_length_15313_cov_10.762390_13_plen_33_part_01